MSEQAMMLKALKRAVDSRDDIEQEMSSMKHKLARRESLVRTLTAQLLELNK